MSVHLKKLHDALEHWARDPTSMRDTAFDVVADLMRLHMATVERCTTVNDYVMQIGALIHRALELKLHMGAIVAIHNVIIDDTNRVHGSRCFAWAPFELHHVARFAGLGANSYPDAICAMGLLIPFHPTNVARSLGLFQRVVELLPPTRLDFLSTFLQGYLSEAERRTSPDMLAKVAWLCTGAVPTMRITKWSPNALRHVNWRMHGALIKIVARELVRPELATKAELMAYMNAVGRDGNKVGFHEAYDTQYPDLDAPAIHPTQLAVTKEVMRAGVLATHDSPPGQRFTPAVMPIITGFLYGDGKEGRYRKLMAAATQVQHGQIVVTEAEMRRAHTRRRVRVVVKRQQRATDTGLPQPPPPPPPAAMVQHASFTLDSCKQQ